MNNRVQQRFDASIREAVAVTQAATRARAPSPETVAARETERDRIASERRAEARVSRARRKAGWRLYLDPETGGTVYGPRP